MKPNKLLRVIDDGPAVLAPPAQAAEGLCPVTRAAVLRLTEDGLISVVCTAGFEMDCEVIELLAGATFVPGDAVVVALPAANTGLGIVLGRVTRLNQPPVPAQVVVKASQSLSIQCGESSIELRADGKIMIRGDDVLVRAKGTKRIRAGSVSIN